MRRRELLRASAGIGVGVAVAGCSDVTNELSGGEGSESRSVSTGDVQSWLYAPGSIGDRDHYQYYFFAPSAIDGARESLNEETFDMLRGIERGGVRGFSGGFKDLTNLDFWDVDGYVYLPAAHVLLGEFDRADVERRLSYNELEYQGNYEGYELYTGDGPTVALEGTEGEDGPPETTSTVVIGEPTSTREGADGTDGDAVARTVLDAGTGSADRYTDEVDAMDTLTTELGTGTISAGRTFEPVGASEQVDLDTDADRINYGQTVQGELSSDDTVEIGPTEYQFFEHYGFHGSEGEAVSATMSADQGTPFIALIDSEDTVIETTFNEKETTANGVRLPPQELPADGTYELHVCTEELLENQTQSLDEPVSYTLTLEVDPSTTEGAAAGVFEGEVARGNVTELDGETTVQRTTLVFEESVPESDVQTWIDENEDEGIFAEYEEVSLSATEGVATVEATIETDEYTPQF